MDYPRVEFYKDAAGEYRWRLRARNHRIVCDSGEGYTTKYKCTEAYERVVQYLVNTTLEEHHDASWKS